jgi:HEAT repeat protein
MQTKLQAKENKKLLRVGGENMGIFGPNLTVMERQKDIEGLIIALKHGDSKIRERAASALDRLKWEPGDEEEKVLYMGAKRAWDDLAAMGGAGLRPLALALTHKDRKVRKLVETMITEAIASHPKTCVDPLVQALPAILKSFNVRTPEAMTKIVGFLGETSDPRAVVPLIQHWKEVFTAWKSQRELKGFDPAMLKYREFIEATIQKMGAPAVDVMVQEMQAKSPSAPITDIVFILGKMGEPAVEPLIQALKHPSSSVRSQAAGALRWNPDARAVEALVAALDDPNDGVRTNVIETLKVWRVPAAGGALAQRLRDKDSRVREKAVLALQELMKADAWIPADDAEAAYFLLAGLLASGSRPKVIFDEIAKLGIRAVEPLIQSLNMEGLIWVRQWGRGSADIKYPASDAAIWLLTTIGQPAVEPLMQALKHQSSTIRCNAARALGEIKDARAKDALTQALEDKDDKVKKAAKAALKRIR